jgi:transposase
LKARDALVRSRTLLINHVRGSVKSFGGRIRSCSAAAFARAAEGDVPALMYEALAPVLELIDTLTKQIRDYDAQVEEICEQSYPETSRLRQVAGVGPLTALCYVLVVEDPKRFARARSVGPYLGLVPRQDDSGGYSPQLSISKAGNAFCRRLLVQASHYVLGPFGPDCDLKRWGVAIAARGGKNAKKRAVVAVARKLAVLLCQLWTGGERYAPLYNAELRAA